MKKFVCISDTHGLHRSMTKPVPPGDFLIFAGDLTNVGELDQIEDFNSWLGELPHKYKIVIAGNHDKSFENFRKEEAKALLTNCIYLEEQEAVLEGIKFYGSPIQPWFHDWAFNRYRGPDIRKHWDAIPDDVQVLITHGPVYGILDNLEFSKERVGCVDLLERVKQLPNLKLHVCGHIHYAHGKKKIDGITYVNASICTESYRPTQNPIVVKLDI